jgi:hypothetical protein
MHAQVQVREVNHDVKSNTDRLVNVVSDWEVTRYSADAKSTRTIRTPPNDQQWYLINEWILLNDAIIDTVHKHDCKFAYPSGIQRKVGVRLEKYYPGDDVTIPSRPANCDHVCDKPPGPLEQYGLWGKPVMDSRQGVDAVWEWAENDYLNMDFCHIQSFIEITIPNYSNSPILFCFAKLFKRPTTIERQHQRNTLLLTNDTETNVLVPAVCIKSHVLILHTCEYSKYVRRRKCMGGIQPCELEVFDRTFGFKPDYDKRIRTKVARSV